MCVCVWSLCVWCVRVCVWCCLCVCGVMSLCVCSIVGTFQQCVHDMMASCSLQDSVPPSLGQIAALTRRTCTGEYFKIQSEKDKLVSHRSSTVKVTGST